MSLIRLGVVKLVALLVFFSVFAVAQITEPICTQPSYAWTFNSVGQSPCTVTAYMMGTCNGGRYALSPLQPGNAYYGPESGNSNLCECSTVGYSLMSSCVACQGEVWISWSEWVTNCTRTLPPGSFPNPVPSGIRVPQWALIDVTNENRWNPNKSYSVGDNIELAAGAILGPSNAAPTTTVLVPLGHSLNPGAIAGGVIGGIAVISITIAVGFFYLRRGSRVPSAAFDVDGRGASQAHMDNTTPPLSDRKVNSTPSSSGSRATMMKVYDPDDPTTFPRYPGTQSLDMPPPGPTSSLTGLGGTLAAMQTSSQGSKGLAKGYHGLPIPDV